MIFSFLCEWDLVNKEVLFLFNMFCAKASFPNVRDKLSQGVKVLCTLDFCAFFPFGTLLSYLSGKDGVFGNSLKSVFSQGGNK